MTRVRGQPPKFPVIATMKKLDDRQPLLVSSLNGGMISSYDPADIPNNAFALAKNVRFRYDYVRRRGGYQLYETAPPTAATDPARGITAIRIGSQISLCFFTDSTSYYFDGSNWNAVGSWYTPDSESYHFTTFIDSATQKMYTIMVNGSDHPYYYDGTTWVEMTSAPRARFVTGFQDRLLMASFGDSPEGRSSIAWCADRVFDEWDASVDETAGEGILRVSSVDTQDDISGLFSYGNITVIPREHSIWLATPTRIASSPFSFYEGVSRLGCDMPDSATITEAGLIFASRHNEEVFLYTPGEAPARIGEPIKKELFAAYNHDTDIVFSAYDYQEGKYVLGINNTTTDLTKMWMFFLHTKAWEYDEIDNVISASGGVQVYDTGGLTIAELESWDGHSSLDPCLISELTGRIIDLRDPAEPAPIPKIYLGTNDGYVLEERYPEREGGSCPDQDYVSADDTTDYTSVLISKEFRIPRDKFMWNEIRLLYTASSAGSFLLYISKDGGDTWTLVKTYTFTASTVKKQFQYSKLWRARRLMWKVEWTAGALTLHEQEILVYTGGQTMPE